MPSPRREAAGPVAAGAAAAACDVVAGVAAAGAAGRPVPPRFHRRDRVLRDARGFASAGVRGSRSLASSHGRALMTCTHDRRRADPIVNLLACPRRAGSGRGSGRCRNDLHALVHNRTQRSDLDATLRFDSKWMTYGCDFDASPTGCLIQLRATSVPVREWSRRNARRLGFSPAFPTSPSLRAHRFEQARPNTRPDHTTGTRQEQREAMPP